MIKHGEIQRVADLVGITRAYMSELISGRKSHPHKKIILRLAALTRTGVALWLTGSRKDKEEAIGRMFEGQAK